MKEKSASDGSQHNQPGPLASATGTRRREFLTQLTQALAMGAVLITVANTSCTPTPSCPNGNILIPCSTGSASVVVPPCSGTSFYCIGNVNYKATSPIRTSPSDCRPIEIASRQTSYGLPGVF